jgi:hypothetical protein
MSDAFAPVTFTKKIGDSTATLTAHSPAEAVKLRFDGWVEKGAARTHAAPAKPDGK